ncbi:MAG TPA: cytochrome c [Roseiflexaceae bacterium]|nr:cytochrome c [Roseiflexaceae bacterium]
MQTLQRIRLPRLSVKLLTRAGVLACCGLFAAACHLDMYDQPAYRAYQESADESLSAAAFPNGAISRAPVAGTVARGALSLSDPVATGLENGQPVDEIPVEVTDALLVRGKERYEVYCVPCHGGIGNGLGPVAVHFRPPPTSFYIERLRNAPDGDLFAVITNGRGLMYPYGSRITPEDRWAIIAHIRQLQENPPPGLRPQDLEEVEVPEDRRSQNIPPKVDPTAVIGR